MALGTAQGLLQRCLCSGPDEKALVVLEVRKVDSLDVLCAIDHSTFANLIVSSADVARIFGNAD